MTTMEKAASIRKCIIETTEKEIAKYSKENVKNAIATRLEVVVNNTCDDILGVNKYFGTWTLKPESPILTMLRSAVDEFIAEYNNKRPIVSLTSKEIEALNIMYRKAYLERIKDMIKTTAMKDAESEVWAAINQINNEVQFNDPV